MKFNLLTITFGSFLFGVVPLPLVSAAQVGSCGVEQQNLPDSEDCQAYYHCPGGSGSPSYGMQARCEDFQFFDGKECKDIEDDIVGCALKCSTISFICRPPVMRASNFRVLRSP